MYCKLHNFNDLMVVRLCHDRALFSDTLDAIKFICKDLWSACWDKQVDNLRTNHRVCLYALPRKGGRCLTRYRACTFYKTIPLNLFNEYQAGKDEPTHCGEPR